MIITHLLNQSRNFYQIDIKVLKENLVKHLTQSHQQHSPDANKKKGSIPAATTSMEVTPTKKDEDQEEEDEEEDEYDYEDDGIDTEE
jgi:hypothetical protein